MLSRARSSVAHRSLLLHCRRATGAGRPARAPLAPLLREMVEGSDAGDSVRVQGWVRSVRRHKKVSFMHVSDGSTAAPVQVVADAVPEGVTVGCSVRVHGAVVAAPGGGGRDNGAREVRASEIEVVGACDAAEYPLQKKVRRRARACASPRALTRTPTPAGAVSGSTTPRSTCGKSRTCALAATRWEPCCGSAPPLRRPSTAFSASTASCRYTRRSSPRMTARARARPFASSPTPSWPPAPLRPAPAATGRRSGTPFATILGSQRFSQCVPAARAALRPPLTVAATQVSGQLQAEMFACALSRVYTFGPTFRAENSHTSRHLSEFWMVEPEVAFAGLDDVADLAEDCLRFVVDAVRGECADDIDALTARGDVNLPARLERLSSGGPGMERVRYADAVAALQREADRRTQSGEDQFLHPMAAGDDLHTEHERWLTEVLCGGSPVAVTHFPAAIKPFYMKRADDGDGDCAEALDVLVPGVVRGASRWRNRSPPMGVP